MSERQLSPRIAQWTVQALTRLFATFGLVQGVFIVIGGAGRWQAPGLAVAMLVPGAPATWGVAIGIIGAIALYGTFRSMLRVTAYAMIAMGAWCLFFATSLILVVIHNDRVATTGVWTYLLASITACTLSAAYLQSRSYQTALRSVP